MARSTRNLLLRIFGRREARFTSLLLISTGVTAGLTLIFNIYISGVLKRARYAEVTSALSLAAILYTFLGPLNSVLARFTAEYVGQDVPGKARALYEALRRRVWWIGGAVVVIAPLLMFPLSGWLGMRSVWSVAFVFVIAYLTLLTSLQRGVLRGAQRFGPYGINTVCESLCRLCIVIVLLQWIVSASTALMAYALALGLVIMLGGRQVHRVFGGAAPQRISAAAVWGFTLPMYVTMLTHAGFQNLDMILVKRLCEDTAAGEYGAAFQLTRLIAVLVTPFNTLMLPMLTAMFTRGEQIAGTSLRLFGYFLAIVAVPVLAFGLIPDVIIRVFNAEYAPAASLLLPMALARVAGYLSHLLATVFIAMQRFRFLYVYVPGMMLEIVLIAFWHASTQQVVWALVGAQGSTLLAMGTLMLAAAWRRKRMIAVRADE